MSDMKAVNKPGYDDLWLWFGLSRAAWLTMPRVLMHEMPDEWQAKMAVLLNEWGNTWTEVIDAVPYVSLKSGGKFVKVPHWIKNYRYPDKAEIQRARR